MAEKLTCRECGYTCSSIIFGEGGRNLTDLDGKTFTNPESISNCKIKYLKSQGIPVEIAREVISKGNPLTNYKGR